MKFSLGRIVATIGIANAMEGNKEFATFVNQSMRRYINQDWGDLSDSDREVNDAAVDDGDRIHASYDFDQEYNVKNAYGTRENSIWIITEGDRSVTTILFPGEY